ncbi:MAG: hypothetical protein IIA67_04965 [Planctomycetes bacterium]|nr:hypothetical protein [Planctomycetota bacterium]
MADQLEQTKQPPPGAEQRFDRLATQWKNERGCTSDVTEMSTHPAYQEIIGMGPVAIPWLLRELESDPDHWFWALRSITGENPIPDDCRGDMTKMVDAWLSWGRREGHLD